LDLGATASPVPARSGISNQTNTPHEGSPEYGNNINSSQGSLLNDGIQTGETANPVTELHEGNGILSNSTSEIGPTISENSSARHMGVLSNTTKSTSNDKYVDNTVIGNDTLESIYSSSPSPEPISEIVSSPSTQTPVVISIEVSKGTDQTISFRDATNRNNVSSNLLSVDKATYSINDQVKVNVADPEANLDDQKEEVVFVIVNSASDPTGIFLELKETGPNTGFFEGTFGTTLDPTNNNNIQTKAGEKVQVQYMGTHPRFKAEFSEVTAAGTVEISDFIIQKKPGEVLPFLPIGGAVNMTLVNSQLNPESTIKVTFSYANIAVSKSGQFNESFTIMVNLGEFGWRNLLDVCADTDGEFCPDSPIINNFTEKTLTAILPWVPGSSVVPGNSLIFTLGACASCGPGGVGGGLAFPGSGVVLDLSLPIQQSTQPPLLPTPKLPGVKDTPNKINPISDLGERNPLLNQTGIIANSNALMLDNLTKLLANQTISEILNATESTMLVPLTINNTTVFPNLGNLSLKVLNNNSNQEFGVSEITSKKDIDRLNLRFDIQTHMAIILNSDNNTYVKAGSIYEPVIKCKCQTDIHTEIAIPYDGSIVNLLRYTSSPALKSEENFVVKLLHYDRDGEWTDVTTDVDDANNRVLGVIDHLSPVVPAIQLIH
jgi:hypothetical protein